MLERILRFFTVISYRYSNDADQQTARNLQLLVITTLLPLLIFFYVPVVSGALGFRGLEYLVLVAIPISDLVTIYLLQTGRLRRAIGLTMTLMVAILVTGLSVGLPNLSIAFALLVPLIAAGIMTDRRTTLLFAFGTAFVFFVSFFGAEPILIRITPDNRVLMYSLTMLMVFIITAFVAIFGSSPTRTALGFARRLANIQTILQASELLDVQLTQDQILPRVIHRLRTDFNISNVQIALIDSNGRTAQRLYMSFGLQELQSGEQIRLDATDVIAEVLRSGVAVRVDTNSSAVRRRHLSPGMMSALVVPIKQVDTVIGALDLQSSQFATFSEGQLELFSAYAARIGSAIARARTISALKNDLATQQALIDAQREQLRAAQPNLREYNASDSWENYFENYTQGMLGFNMDEAATRMIPASDVSPAMRRTFETGGLHQITEGDQTVVTAPLRLRDQLLGALAFHFAGDTVLSERQRDLIENVMQRLALALENRRLFEQSQSQASRESKANEVASLLLSSTDVQTVLQLAAASFHNALGAVSTNVQLQVLEIGENR